MKNKMLAAVKKSALKKILVFSICLLFIEGFTGKLYAQVSSKVNFTQRIQWNADPNVFEYQIEIQNSYGNTIQSLTTQDNFVNISLPQGSYRYKITAFDLLGRESVSTGWKKLEILRANQPAITHNQSLESLGEDGKTLEVDVNIKDVSKDSKVELVNTKTGERISGTLIIAATSSGAGTAASAISASEVNLANKASFKNVPEGNWKLIVTNPSGLSSESESFDVKDIFKEQQIAAKKAEEERLAREEAQRIEQERIAKELAIKAEEERIIREKAAKEEAERLAVIQAQREEEERKFKEELDRVLQERLVKQEQERKEAMAQVQKQQEEKKARQQAELERIEFEKQEAERLVREEEERLAREEAEREEAERLALEAEEEEERMKEEKEKRKEKWTNYDRKYALSGGAGISLFLYDDDFFSDFGIRKNDINTTLNARFSYLPLHPSAFRFGLELDGLVSRYNVNNEFYNFDLNMLNASVNMVARVGFAKKKLWLQLKGGGGLTLLQENLDYNESSANNKNDKLQNYGYFNAGGGLSFIFIPVHLITFEVGADYSNLFISDTKIGIISPYLNLGIRF